ncbi:hypothetical protein ABIC35_002556 [Sphingomonas trueperi]
MSTSKIGVRAALGNSLPPLFHDFVTVAPESAISSQPLHG